MGNPAWLGNVRAGAHFPDENQGFQCQGSGDVPVPHNLRRPKGKDSASVLLRGRLLDENHSQQSKTKQLEYFFLRTTIRKESHRMTQFSCREKVEIVELIFVTGVINAKMATTY